MGITRREFLELSSGSIVYGLAFACGVQKTVPETVILEEELFSNHALRYFIDYTEWLFIHPDGSVTAHTGRTELGQGITTVLTNFISQGLDLPEEKIQVVLGDTDLCPDDGPTEGSSATRIVGWGYWHACERIRHDLIRRAAERLKCSEKKLMYRGGAIVGRKDEKLRVTIEDLVDGTVQLTRLNPTYLNEGEWQYVDKATPNVNANAIVTGTLKFTGDLFPGECEYGACLCPKYHIHLTKVVKPNLASAKKVRGVTSTGLIGRSAYVVGETYSTVQRGLEAMNANWSIPTRSKELQVEAEIRAGAALHKVIEERGNPEKELPLSAVILTETYLTQYASQVPIETESAIARVDGENVTVWASTQAPFKARSLTANRLKIPEEKVRIISMPVGGGFGVKVNTPAPMEAAMMAKRSGKTVKYIYSRDHQFVNRARFKEAVVADISSGVTKKGRLVSRTLDLYQDEGAGSTDTYDIPHVLTRLYRTEMPARHGTMRGTSFVQTCFAVESHTDMLAEAVGLDPIEFRKQNLALPAFGPLLDACAEMMDYGQYDVPPDHGIGFAICTHGGRQLGAMAAEVAVDRTTGIVRVQRLAGAFDIGMIVNINTVSATIKGAILWGLGFALFEEVVLDGHSAYTTSLDTYRIPRFSDVPPIKIAFYDNYSKMKVPRGVGELPVIPTVGAIGNAVYDAIGVRFHTLPLTPAKVLAGLSKT